MKCDKCSKEATVHEVTIKGGKQHEKHLCEQCAAAEGFTPQVPTPLTSLLTQFITQQTAEAPKAAATQQPATTPTCPDCATTYNQFRQSGLLGCPTCYEAFEQQIGPLLARAHEGGTHHVGKRPRHLAGQSRTSGGSRSAVAAGPDPKALAEQLATLKRTLAEAIAAEQYEKAAKIRDQIAHLEPGTKWAPQPTPPKRPRKPRSESSGESSGSGGQA